MPLRAARPEDVPYEQWTCQPFPGANHIAWNLLHLLVAEDWGPTALGEEDRPWVDLFDALVRQGPLPDIASYPPRDAMLAALESAHTRFTRLLDSLEESDLDRKTSGAIAEYAPDLGTVLDSHIWHEGFHAGEIAMVRRALGMTPKFG